MPISQLPEAKTWEVAIMDMSNKEMLLCNGWQAPNPSHDDVEPKLVWLPPGLKWLWAVDDDRIQVWLHNLKNQEKNKQITNFPF